ncbi:amidohydrolase family protein [Rubellimicrobium arenae]|uniref:amidohydrolase family protein n=1 Tax=Rubellimicrobium arenae TaxID=2817372 RepID=UPI001B3119C6|nr:amidohydrolase family protein [Rubellimicrobium arenae]
MLSFLLHGATVLTVDPSNRVLIDGWISVEDGRIAGLGSGATRPDPARFDEVLDLSGHLVMPGLVNAHTHAAMILFRGRSEGHSLLTMDGWYHSIREPELSLGPGDIGPAVALSCAEMALSGTTTFCDQYFHAEEVARAADASGLRAVVAYGIVELGDLEHGRAELERAVAFVEGQRRGRVIPWFGPHAPFVDNSEQTLMAEVEAANRLGCGMHLHMAAGPEDNEDTLARWGLTATQALERSGFFAGRVHAAHCLDLSPQDIAIFAAAPAASVAHCATAGLRSGREGICPVVDLRRAGVIVALGTDNVAANNAYDMVTEMKVAGLVASHREGRAQPIPSRDLIRMATIDGARALGLGDETGSLEIGKAADIAVFDMRGPGWSETPEIETALVYSGSGRDLRHLWVAGEALVRDRRLLRADFDELRRDYAATYRNFWDRVARGERAA